MNFADEPYVRVYKRRTTTMAVVGWEARALLRELFLIVDRAGVLDLDDEDPADAVTALIADMSIEVIRPALVKLAAKGCIQIGGGKLVIPRFREAQETPASDKLRARESREVRRLDAMSDTSRNVTPESRNVTNESQNVTERHAESHDVTPCHSEQYSTDQNSTVQELGSRATHAHAHEDAPLPPAPPPEVARRKPIATPNAAPPPTKATAIDTRAEHSEPPAAIPPSAGNVVPASARRIRATDDLMTCPIAELAARCRLNQYDAGMSPVGNRPELNRVNEAWAEAVGLAPRKLGSYSDRNRPLKTLLEAFETATEEELLAACATAARDDWCTGRKGNERDPPRKRDIGCLTKTVLDRLLAQSEAQRPGVLNPRVAAMLAAEDRRLAGGDK